jgi:hypothetical protein
LQHHKPATAHLASRRKQARKQHQKHWARPHGPRQRLEHARPSTRLRLDLGAALTPKTQRSAPQTSAKSARLRTEFCEPLASKNDTTSGRHSAGQNATKTHTADNKSLPDLLILGSENGPVLGTRKRSQKQDHRPRAATSAHPRSIVKHNRIYNGPVFGTVFWS